MVMFGLSYVYHGVLTTDYQTISYPLQVYLVAAGVAYLFIGFLVSRAFLIPWFDRFTRHPLLRGPAIGFACGILVYFITIAVSVTIGKGVDLRWLVLDITWQGIDQALGGTAVGLVYMFVFEPMPMEPEDAE